MVVDESGVETRTMVDVIEAVREVGGDLHPRNPGGEDGKIGVSRIPETFREACSGDEFVNQINVIPRN